MVDRRARRVRIGLGASDTARRVNMRRWQTMAPIAVILAPSTPPLPPSISASVAPSPLISASAFPMPSPSTALPVAQGSDAGTEILSLVLDATATLAAILALILAVVAIRGTKAQSDRADQAMIRERRTVFELEAIRDLLGYLESGAKITKINPARLALLPADELPAWRLLAGWPKEEGWPWLHARLDELGVPRMEDDVARRTWALQRDLDEAISRRMR